jgi:hypothetical protein
MLAVKIASSGMLRYVPLVRNDFSEEPSASIISETKIGELRTSLAVTSNRRTLRRNDSFLRSVHRLIVTDKVPISLILVTLMKEALRSS